MSEERRIRRVRSVGMTAWPLLWALAIFPGHQAAAQGQSGAVPPAGEGAVKVRVVGEVKGGLPWRFWATQPELFARPGETVQTSYRARNVGDQPITGKAYHLAEPPIGEQLVEIIGCFCLELLTLKPGEERELPLAFRIKWDAPADFKEVMIEYDFWPAEEEKK